LQKTRLSLVIITLLPLFFACGGGGGGDGDTGGGTEEVLETTIFTDAVGYKATTYTVDFSGSTIPNPSTTTAEVYVNDVFVGTQALSDVIKSVDITFDNTGAFVVKGKLIAGSEESISTTSTVDIYKPFSVLDAAMHEASTAKINEIFGYTPVGYGLLDVYLGSSPTEITTEHLALLNILSNVDSSDEERTGVMHPAMPVQFNHVFCDPVTTNIFIFVAVTYHAGDATDHDYVAPSNGNNFVAIEFILTPAAYNEMYTNFIGG
jgi:hypothetical protein